MPMSIELQTELSRCKQGQHHCILTGFRESALRASRAMAGAPQRRGGLDKTMERVEFESMCLWSLSSDYRNAIVQVILNPF